MITNSTKYDMHFDQNKVAVTVSEECFEVTEAHFGLIGFSCVQSKLAYSSISWSL